MAEFYVKVRPDSENFEIAETGNITEVKLEQPAENSRANTELIRKLGEILGQKPGIVSGHQSRRKKLRVDMPEEALKEGLTEAE